MCYLADALQIYTQKVIDRKEQLQCQIAREVPEASLSLISSPFSLALLPRAPQSITFKLLFLLHLNFTSPELLELVACGNINFSGLRITS